MITFTHKGDFKGTSELLKSLRGPFNHIDFNKFGRMGVEALRAATPVRTGLTANSWTFDVKKTSNTVTITWSNTNVQNGWANIAVLIQYGHGTRNGAYVKGIDYVNPAMKPLFDQIADDAWKEVTVSK